MDFGKLKEKFAKEDKKLKELSAQRGELEKQRDLLEIDFKKQKMFIENQLFIIDSEINKQRGKKFMLEEIYDDEQKRIDAGINESPSSPVVKDITVKHDGEEEENKK